MPNTAAQSAKISETEIKMRVKGIIADTFGVGACEVRGPLIVKLVGVKVGEAPRSLTWVAVVVDQIQRSFGVRIEEAHTNTFRELATVGELIALVEGALSAGGMA
jgi:hypothetical protein